MTSTLTLHSPGGDSIVLYVNQSLANNARVSLTLSCCSGDDLLGQALTLTLSQPEAIALGSMLCAKALHVDQEAATDR